jgi:hypothetical protein
MDGGRRRPLLPALVMPALGLALALACSGQPAALSPDGSMARWPDAAVEAHDAAVVEAAADGGADSTANAGPSVASLYGCAQAPGQLCLLDPPFRAVWQSGPDDVWILVSDFQEVSLRHWDGSAWTSYATGAGALSALWGSAPNDLWAVGPAGSIVHGDGHGFVPVASGTDATLGAVWGSGAGDVWAVGTTAQAPARGVTLHWDGTAWSSIDCCDLQPDGTSQLNAVWGSGAGDVWAAGAEVTTAGATRLPYAIHWDGAAWSRVAVAGTGLGLTAGWSGGSADVWFGAETQLLHFDGAAITTSKSGIIGTIAALWGSGPGDVWAVRAKGGILHWDGSGWRSSPSATANDLSALSGSGAADVWSVGPVGTVIHWDGQAWTPLADGSQGPLQALWGSSASDLWTSGPLHWNGHLWAADQTDSTIPALDLCGFAPDDVWAAGVGLQNGLDAGYLGHLDGSGVWTIVGIENVYAPFTDADPTLGPSSLRALWCHTPTDVWAVGQMEGIVGTVVATVVHYDGDLWSPVAAPTTWDLNGVWGSGADDIWAAGGNGTLIHWDGGAWTAVPSGTTSDLGAVWGSAADDVWVVVLGDTRFLHWDGAAWSSVPSGTSHPNLARIWGTGRGDVWAVGGDATSGVVVHFDGSAWSTSWNPPAAVGRLAGIWGSGGALFVVAQNGMIFARQ